MKHLFTVLIAMIMSVGCATIPLSSGDPPNHVILIESGVIALAFYESHDDIENNQQRGLAAIVAADNYLRFMYGNGVLGQNQKYTFSQLLHSEVLNKIVDPRLKKLAYVARIVVNKDGTLTGVSWADALLLGIEVSGVDPINEQSMRANVVDDIVVQGTVYSEVCDGDLFKVYMEEIQSKGSRGVKPVPSNIWRVYYTDINESSIPFMRHYVNKERAQAGFREAVDWNGFLGLD